MQSEVNVFVLLVAIIVSLLQGGIAYELVGDLSALQDQYQTLLTELESTDTTYDTSIATLLEKLDLLQYSPSSPSNVTLDWFNPPKDTSTHPPLRIIMVVSSFEGMFLNSGIGTFYSSLADFLVQKGHAITVLYTDTAASDTPAYSRWKTQVEKRGLRAARLGAYPIHLRLSSLAQRSYQVYDYLKNHQPEFDVVHFPDWEGPGYYSMLAKKDGIEFLSKLFIVGIHGPWRWVKAANNPYSSSSTLTSAEDIETDWMERKSVEMADMAWSPSSDIVKWLEAQGWTLPSSTLRMAYLPGREVSQMKLAKNNNDELTDVNELVFFGRMETRKGLVLFADALDRLAVTRPEFAGTKITFLGSVANIGNQTANAYINERFVKGSWPFKVVYISHKDRKGALEYLREPSRIAVMPSIVDNTPYTVYECLFSSIPFIASDIPSIASIIAPEGREDVLFEPNSVSLAQKLENVLDNGVRRVRSSLNLDEIESSWVGFYAKASSMIAEQKTAVKATENQMSPNPLVSVCITHYNRPQFLQLALESVEATGYPNFEVVLVDDGSTTQDAKDYLTMLGPIFADKGWQLVLSNNQYLGAARNKAAQFAHGDYLLFLDDDNLVTPQTLRTYVDVAVRTRADILTAAHDVFEGTGRVEEGTVVGRWIPLGASPALGIFKNCFGDANFFIKKSVFTSLKGFTEDRGVGQEDHEFLAKAVLAGRSLTVIPEPLLSYRMHNQSDQMLYTTDSLRNALRAHRPYRVMMEESGIDITELGMTSTPTKNPESLKLMALTAFSRAHSRQVFSTCNLTISSVVPTQIPARKASQLTFRTAIRDCDIQTIRIGDTYVCTIGTVQTSTFTCTTQAIPIPGNYPIFLQFTTETTFRDTGSRITVTPVRSQDGATTALTTLAVYREQGLFNSNELLGLVANIVPLSPSDFNMLSDTVSGGSNQAKRDQNATGELQLHTTVVSITSANPSAADAFNLIYNVLTVDPSVILPYRFAGFLLNAICSAGGECSCGPNFEGVGCTTPTTCPNGCSGNGNCISGPNGKVCQCVLGWAGLDCSTGMCPNNCNGHGTCNLELQAGNGSCACDPGWKGFGCEVPNCPNNCSGNACSSNGTCLCPKDILTPDCATLAEGDSSGKIIVTHSGGDDKHDERVFIGITVMFLVLVAIAVGVALYVRHRSRKAADRAADLAE